MAHVIGEVKQMTSTVTLFIPDSRLIPLEELHEVSALHTITTLTDAAEQVIGYQLTWPDVRLSIGLPQGEDLEERINAFQLHVDALLGQRTDKKAKKIWRRAERMVSVIECSVEPGWDDERKAQHVVQAVMAYYDYALMLADDTVYNENGNIEIGLEASKPKYWAQEVEAAESDSAAERKQRSIEQLKAEQIPYIVHLPVIADEGQVTLRSKETACERAMALSLIARRADGESLDWYLQKIKQYQLQDAITEDEMDFAQEDEPVDYGVVKFSRRLESYWLLLWALGYVNRLSKPNTFANAQRAHTLLDTRSPQQFLLDAKLRSKKEILDAADLYYRYDWAVVDAELYGKSPPRGLEPDVVYERHYALNWLVAYNNLPWDEITTDT